MSQTFEFRAERIAAIISQSGAVLLCLYLLKNSIPPVSQNPHYLLLATIFIIARFALYLQGVALKTTRKKIAFFGIEYCASGYALAQTGAPTSFVMFLFALGLFALIVEYRDILSTHLVHTP